MKDTMKNKYDWFLRLHDELKCSLHKLHLNECLKVFFYVFEMQSLC